MKSVWKKEGNYLNFSENFNLQGAEQYVPYIPARVTAEHRERYELVGEQGEFYGKLKSAEYFGENASEVFPTVGDFVLVDYNGSGDSRIVRTLPRTSVFERPDPSYGRQRPQAVAANFDFVFIVLSLNRDFNEKKLARYLTLSWQSGAQPVVVLTKLDLKEEGYERMILVAENAAFGVPVCPVSSLTGEGLDALNPFLQPGKTAALLGSSGAGKSSLINALAGEALMKTGAVREEDARGRHTTTHRQMLRLPSGALVIDTPGMRELGMWDVTEGLSDAFSDITQLAENCRFADCQHESEPGCAVRMAIECGDLEEIRLIQYRKLKKEARYSDDPNAYIRQRTEERKRRMVEEHKKTNYKRRR